MLGTIEDALSESITVSQANVTVSATRNIVKIMALRAKYGVPSAETGQKRLGLS